MLSPPAETDSRQRLLRWSLLVAAGFNVFGALVFGFPDSALGQILGLPSAVPLPYRAMTALFVLLFGGSYAWLAVRPVIHRPWVAFGALGKLSAFTLVMLLWLMGELPFLSVAAVSGDLFLALLFFWCLAGMRDSE